ncbi:hypothetical protein ACFC0D_03695 [Streptomyces sp. NPDC056222]|uniref:hypothetical protein n=1 Tax=Streptomyces sp. NPDC056222 TaxID=3345749 RepID=UPI0035DC2D17
MGRLVGIALEGAYRQVKIDEATSVRLTVTGVAATPRSADDPGEISTHRRNIRITEAVRGTAP